jgi:hypothetical protein
LLGFRFVLCRGGLRATTSTARSKRAPLRRDTIRALYFSSERSMPQQPLSRVRPTARVLDSPQAFERRPELTTLLGVAIGTWAEVEARMIGILSAFLGGSSDVATAMVQVPRSASLQFDMIRAAGKARLKDPELELFEAIMNIADRIGTKKRNPLVHDIWGWSDELPDALLRIEVSAAIEVMLNIERTLEERANLPIQEAFNHPSLKFNPDRVWVYRKQDFQEIIEEMNKLRLYITAMHHFRPGSVTRDSISQLLNTEHLLQDELARVRLARTTNQ